MVNIKRKAIFAVAIFFIFLLVFSSSFGILSSTRNIPVSLASNGNNSYQLRITQISTSKFPEISAYTSFTDKNGETVNGLNKSFFTVLEDGNQIDNFDVTSVRKEGKNIATVIAIDCSYSMKDSGALEKARNGASEFVKMMKPGDQCTVMSFSRKITYRISDDNGNPVFTSDKNVLLNAIQSIQPEPFTRLYDGLYDAIDVANSSASFRKAVLILTDVVKEDEESTHDVNDCISHATDLDIPIYAIGEGSNVNASPLEKATQETNGIYLFAANPDELLKLYQQISHNIHNEYIVSYNSRIKHSEEPKKHTLTLKIDYEGNVYTVTKEFIPTVLPAQHSLLGLILLIILAIFFILFAVYFAWRRNKKQCPQCGKLIDKNTSICPYCGYSFVPTPEPEPEPTSAVAEEVEEEKTRVIHKEKKGLAWLTVIDGKDKGKTFELADKEVFSIGRNAVNDVLLEDDSVSREHAKISVKNNVYLIHDLASLNGTFVNDKQVDVSTIKDSDVIYIGDVGLVFKVVKKEGKNE